MWNYPKFHTERAAGLWLYMLHPCQWFYIWLHCYRECTLFLCGWWQWWGCRVEMGFSCSCLWVQHWHNIWEEICRGRRVQSVYLPHSRISTIALSWAMSKLDWSIFHSFANMASIWYTVRIPRGLFPKDMMALHVITTIDFCEAKCSGLICCQI